MKVDPAAPLKDPKDYTIVGTPRAAPRHSRQDLRHASTSSRTSRCPACCMRAWCIPRAIGATLEASNDAACRKIPGYVARGAQGQFPRRGRDQRMGGDPGIDDDRRDQWSDWAGLPEESKLFEYVRSSKIDRDEVLQIGRRHDEGAERRADERLQATYDFAINTHGSIGPSCAVADFKDGMLTVWTRVAGEPPAARAARDACWT